MAKPFVPTWAVRVSRAESMVVLERLMDDWYRQVQADRGLQAVVGFESSMGSRDWDSAKGSIERTYGRSTREHQGTLDTLAAAIQCKRMLRIPTVR
jgi:hypothetical protein